MKDKNKEILEKWDKETEDIYLKIRKLFDSDIWDAELIMEVFHCNVVVGNRVIKKLLDDGFLKHEEDKEL